MICNVMDVNQRQIGIKSGKQVNGREQALDGEEQECVCKVIVREGE